MEKKPIPGATSAFAAKALLGEAIKHLEGVVKAHEEGTKEHRLVQNALADARQSLSRLNRRIQNG